MTPLLMPGSTGLRTKTFSLVLRTETVYPALRGQNQTCVEFSIHETNNCCSVSQLMECGVLGSTGFVRKYVCPQKTISVSGDGTVSPSLTATVQ